VLLVQKDSLFTRDEVRISAFIILGCYWVETYLEHMILRVALVIQLILERIAVEAHFQLAAILGDLLNQVHSVVKMGRV
jgi:hypothetical protein